MIKSEIIADSISQNGKRLTSFTLEYPRFIHSELMTHRVFSKNAASCLGGDSVIYIEKPSHLKKGKKTKHSSLTIQEIVQKWNNGDSLGRDMKFRLRSMNLRCLNEDTNEFTTTKIVNCIKSGAKELYEIELENKKKIKCTKEHRIFSSNGWITLNDLEIQAHSFGISWNKNCPEIATNGTEIKLSEILDLKNQGLNLTKICEIKGFNYKAASSICEKNKVFFKKVHLENEIFDYKDREWLSAKLSEGLFVHQIATICNTTVDRVKKSMKKLKLNGNRWNWGMKPVWNKGLKYSLPDSSLVKVRDNAKKRRKANSYREYKDLNSAITRFLTEIRLSVMEKFNWKCQVSLSGKNLQLHHIDPVWHNKSLAFDVGNIVPLNKRIHRFIHANNLDLEFLEWVKLKRPLTDFMNFYSGISKISSEIGKPVSKGNYLTVKFSKIKSVKYLGLEETFDLEVEGPYHNFVANGIVVHNSRAIPFEKFTQQIKDNPAIPEFWGKNQSGMQAKEELDRGNPKIRLIVENGSTLAKSLSDKDYANQIWLEARDSAISQAKRLNDLGCHKQIVNRILEPWFHIRVILSGTEFENFFALRAHPDAQPEFRVLAERMLENYNNSTPKALEEGEWHIPFGDKIDKNRVKNIVLSLDPAPESVGILKNEIKKKIAVARCARVSYHNFEGKDDYEADIKLCDRLFGSVPRHLSPTEHVAQCMNDDKFYGNFCGFKQYRYFFADQNLKDSRIIKK